MVEVGLLGIAKYITRRQNTVTEYITTRQILELCERSTRSPRVRVSRQWWEQAGLDLELSKIRAAEAAAESDGEELIGEEEVIPLE